MQDNLDFGKTEYLSERKAIVRRIKQQEFHRFMINIKFFRVLILTKPFLLV